MGMLIKIERNAVGMKHHLIEKFKEILFIKFNIK